MGGQPGGAEAADTALATFQEATVHNADIPRQLSQLLQQANAAIISRGDREPEFYNMGATTTLLLIDKDQAHWAHIGDSRLYHLQGEVLTQISRDHNLAQELFEEGKISKEEQQQHPLAHFLSQCLGEDDIEPESGSFRISPDDILLLCSDGVHDMLDDIKILRCISGTSNLTERANSLMQAALTAGGKDNISLILLQIK
jgi:protein phosphatase